MDNYPGEHGIAYRSAALMWRHKILSIFITPLLAVGGYEGYQHSNQIAEAYHVWNNDNPGDLPPESPDLVPRSTSYLCFSEAPNCDSSNALASLSSEGNNIPVTLAQISDNVKNATIAVEDARFLTREGIDYKALARAAGADILAGGIVQGGSDITEQVVKNDYVKSSPHYDKQVAKIPLSLNDKIDNRIWEIGIASTLDATYTTDKDPATGIFRGKYTILEKYLNIVNYGRGTRGIEAAAQAYFGKSAATLSVVEAATLAGIPKNPDGNDGSTDLTKDAQEQAHLLARRNHVLNQMAVNGYIAQTDYATFSQQPLNITPFHEFSYGLSSNYSVANSIGARHFVDMALTEVKKLSGYTSQQLASGLRINTTLSFAMQAQIYTAQKQANYLRDGRELAVVAEKQDGEIVGMYGGDYATTQTNLTTQPQPGGSADKPYFYTEALIKGTTSLDNNNYTDPPQFDWIAGNSNGTDWITTGGDHCKNHQTCTPREALAVSSNPVALQVTQAMGQTGLADTYALMEAFGSHSITPPLPAAVLGARETSQLDRTVMMNSLVANRGASVMPFLISSTFALENGQLVNKYTATPQVPKQVVDPNIADQIIDALRGVPKFGTAANALSSLTSLTDSAGKTGTDEQNKIANYYGVECITPNDGSARYNLTLSVAERYPDKLASLGTGQTGANVPAKTFKAIVTPLIGKTCLING